MTPSTFNFYATNPNFTSFGYGEIDIKGGANSIEVQNKGKYYLKFKDGVLHRLRHPKAIIYGLMIGKRYFNFRENLIVEDLVIKYF